MADENEEELINKLRIMIDDADDISDELLSAYLGFAKDKVLNRLYPFGIPEDAEVPNRYISNELNIACYLINKRGAEGETAHSENGVSRTYENADVPASLLDDIYQVPKVGSYEMPK